MRAGPADWQLCQEDDRQEEEELLEEDREDSDSMNTSKLTTMVLIGG